MKQRVKYSIKKFLALIPNVKKDISREVERHGSENMEDGLY